MEPLRVQCHVVQNRIENRTRQAGQIFQVREEIRAGNLKSPSSHRVLLAKLAVDTVLQNADAFAQAEQVGVEVTEVGKPILTELTTILQLGEQAGAHPPLDFRE